MIRLEGGRYRREGRVEETLQIKESKSERGRESLLMAVAVANANPHSIGAQSQEVVRGNPAIRVVARGAEASRTPRAQDAWKPRWR